MTVVSAPLAPTADLLKLTTTRPGHLLPGPGAIAADCRAKIESIREASVIPAAPTAVIFKKFLRLVEFFFLMSWPTLPAIEFKEQCKNIRLID
jgi:hypothetical protein